MTYQSEWSSLEKVPLASGFLCMSLKFGCILTSLICIVYSTLGLAVCVSQLGELDKSPDRLFMLTIIILDSVSHLVSFVLAFVLLLGLLKDNAHFIRPWVVWTTFQTLAYCSLFIFINGVQYLQNSSISLVAVLIEVAILALRFYMLMLVVTYFKELRQNQIHRQLISQDEKFWTKA